MNRFGLIALVLVLVGCAKPKYFSDSAPETVYETPQGLWGMGVTGMDATIMYQDEFSLLISRKSIPEVLVASPEFQFSLIPPKIQHQIRLVTLVLIQPFPPGHAVDGIFTSNNFQWLTSLDNLTILQLHSMELQAFSIPPNVTVQDLVIENVRIKDMDSFLQNVAAIKSLKNLVFDRLPDQVELRWIIDSRPDIQILTYTRYMRAKKR